MSFTEEEVKRITRASLIFRALEQIGSQEIAILQGTAIDKGKVKIKLREVRNILDKEFLKDNKNHTVIDLKRLKDLRSEEIELLSLPEGSMVKRKLDLHNGEKSVDISVSVSELLKEIRQERKEILSTDDDAHRAYYAVCGFVEKIALEITKLDLEQIIDLDLLFGEYLAGNVKFTSK